MPTKDMQEKEVMSIRENCKGATKVLNPISECKEVAKVPQKIIDLPIDLALNCVISPIEKPIEKVCSAIPLASMVTPGIPIYNWIYKAEHAIEKPLDLCVFGYTRDEAEDWRFRCMEGRLNICYERMDELFMSVPLLNLVYLPSHIMMKVFLRLHQTWLKVCPTYQMMSIIDPDQFGGTRWLPK